MAIEVEHHEVDVDSHWSGKVRDGLAVTVSPLGDNGFLVTEEHTYSDEMGLHVEVNKHPILPPEPTAQRPFDPSQLGFHYSINGIQPDGTQVLYRFQRKQPVQRATIYR